MADSLIYKCMPRSILYFDGFSLETVQPEHIELIRVWRNAQMDVLRQSRVITSEIQEKYFRDNIWSQLNHSYPDNILLIYKKADVPIGYGGLVHVAWEHRRAEISFLLNSDLKKDKDEYARCFLFFLSLIKQLAFEDLQLERIFVETYASRKHHISILEDFGFKQEGRLRGHVVIDGKRIDSLIHSIVDYDL